MAKVFDIHVAEIASMIDHSLLRPDLDRGRLEAGAAMAAELGVATVCCMPCFVGRCAEILRGSGTAASTVIGFPLGYVSTAIKLAEAREALDAGAAELDAVVNVSAVLSDDLAAVDAEVAALVELVHGRGARLKLIFENCLLNDARKLRLCSLCAERGVDWIKTSTGFGADGATIADVRLMRAHYPAHLGVKAAGGIRSINDLLAFKRAGADRIGTSATRDILAQISR